MTDASLSSVVFVLFIGGHRVANQAMAAAGSWPREADPSAAGTGCRGGVDRHGPARRFALDQARHHVSSMR